MQGIFSELRASGKQRRRLRWDAAISEYTALNKDEVLGRAKEPRVKSSRAAWPQVARTSPCDSQTYEALRARFSATLGEEQEVEVGLVQEGGMRLETLKHPSPAFTSCSTAMVRET